MFDLMKIARMGMVAAGFIAAWFAWLWQHDAKVSKKVETNIVQRSKARGSAANAKAATIYNSTKRPGAADRLRNDKLTCPDCR